MGKSWLACALGHKACRDNRSVLYQRIPRLFTDLALAHGDGRYPRLMRALGGVKLLILDDWGLEPLGAEQRHDLLEIAEERYGRGATLITSQLPVDLWHNVIGDPAGACHPRPTSIGMAGRHQSEQVADFSPESPADIVGIRNECFFSRIRSC